MLETSSSSTSAAAQTPSLARASGPEREPGGARQGPRRAVGEDERVVITGLGAFTPYGLGFARLRQALAEDRRGLRLVDERLPEARGRSAGLCGELELFRSHFPEIKPPLPVPLTRMVLLAARDALADAGLLADAAARAATGLMLNRNRGPASVVAQTMEPVLTDGPRKLSPLRFVQTVSNAPAGAVATTLGLHGPHLLTMGGGALLLAFESLRAGEAPAILCGGFEEVDANSLLAAESNGTVHPAAPPTDFKPFSAEGPGGTLGEGAVFLLLERASAAAARGARVYAELAAISEGLDPFVPALADEDLRGWGRPDAGALTRVAADALADAGLPPEAIGLVVCGANGERAIDTAEGDAARRLGLGHLPLHTLKGHVGDGQGLAGALSLAWAADRLSRGDELLATCGAGPGVRPLAARAALVTQIEYQALYSAAVLQKVAP